MLKRCAPLLLLAYAGCTTPMPVTPPDAHQPPGLWVKFQKASPAILLNDYAEKTGSRIEIVTGLDIHRQEIELKSDEPLTMQQYLAAVEDKLREHNVGLYPIGSNRIVAAWIDPSKAPQPAPLSDSTRSHGGANSYLERMRARRAQIQNRPIEAHRSDGTELERKLREYNSNLLKDARSFEYPTNTPGNPAPEKGHGLESVPMPLPDDNARLGGTVSNVVIEAEKGGLVDAMREAVGIPAGGQTQDIQNTEEK